MKRARRKTADQLIAERHKRERGGRTACSCCGEPWYAYRCTPTACGKVRPDAAPFSTILEKRRTRP